MTTAVNLDAPTPNLDRYLCSLPKDEKAKFLTQMLNEHLRQRQFKEMGGSDLPEADDLRRKLRHGVLTHRTLNLAGNRGTYAMINAVHDSLYAHGMLYTLCGIVHGDISCNNVRVYMLSEFEPIGVLVDYDNRTDTWEPPTLTSEERKSLTPPKEHLKQKTKIHLDNAIARLKRMEEEKKSSESNESEDKETVNQ